ncbi:hypothetical protein BSKO_09332 [Bryopsis sp. KO-2023]|nr:hypothetical protein BSKO_09332 [Bryopsis sp. KO-2023]
MQFQNGHAGGEGPVGAGIQCGDCGNLLVPIEGLRITDDVQGVQVTIWLGFKGSCNIVRIMNNSSDSQYCPKRMQCGDCRKDVGKCMVGNSMEGGLLDHFSADKTQFLTPLGQILKAKKWSTLKEDIKNAGVLLVKTKELVEEAGRRYPSREGLQKYPTFCVDMSAGCLPPETLQQLTKTRMRNYQEEMLHMALMENSLVCLPTGSGKTLISAAAIHAMLRLNPCKIVVFVVTKNALVEQQARVITTEIPGIRVQTWSGQQDPINQRKAKKALAKFELDVLVCTSQILVNRLEHDSIRVEDICLLVLDEAHNANKDDPMTKVIKQATRSDVQPGYRPLIMGMTATPMETPKREFIMGDLFSACQRVRCHARYPLVNDPFENGINKTRNWVLAPPAEGKEQDFKVHLLNYMHKVWECGSTIIQALEQPEIESEMRGCIETLSDTNKFRGCLRKLFKALGEMKGANIDSRGENARRKTGLIDSATAWLGHFLQVLAVMEVNEIVGWSIAQGVMKNVLQDVQDPKTMLDTQRKSLLMPGNRRDYIRDMADEVAKADETFQQHRLSARCKLLIEILLHHIQTNQSTDDGARILVFVDMRRTAKKLHDCLNKHESIFKHLNPQVLVGQGIQGDGLSWAEQSEILKSFDLGITKLLIATTVLEEGLDVPKCNLVVRFQAPGTYGAFVQSRGRACRGENGEFRIICKTQREQEMQFEFAAIEAELLAAMKQYMREHPPTQDVSFTRQVLDMRADFDRQDYKVRLECGSDSNSSSDAEESDDEDIKDLLNFLDVQEGELVTGNAALLDEFDNDQMVVSLQCISTEVAPNINLRQRVEDIFKSVAQVIDWVPVKLPTPSRKLRTEDHPRCRLVPVEDLDIDDPQQFEKFCIERALATSTRGRFWMSFEKSVMPESSSIRLEVAKLKIGSWFSHHQFLYLSEKGRTCRLQVDCARKFMTITYDTIHSIEWSFDELHYFIVVTRDDAMRDDDMDGVGTVSIYFTLKNPPRLLDISSGPANAKRVTHFGRVPDDVGNVFGHCLTYQLDIPNPHDKTERHAFESSITKCLDMLTKNDKEVFYTSLHPQKYPTHPLPGPGDGIDKECIYHEDREVNYAWRCLTGCQGFVRERFTDKFFQQLNKLSKEDVAALLYKMVGPLDGGLFLKPHELILQILEGGNHKLRMDCEGIEQHAIVKRVAITPTRLLFFPPDLMQTNRVLSDHQTDNFLRVNIRDETMENLTSIFGELGELVGRVGTVMREGIDIADTHYDYLASSNSQMRSHSCWFVEENGLAKDGTADIIRRSMGELGAIRNVATYVSRMGQGFSTSFRTIDAEDVVVLDDVEQGEYVFSDGIGKIPVQIAEEISAAIHLPFPPSAFQIRLGGCKGVVAIDPSCQPGKVFVRQSMKKYESDHNYVEVLERSRPSPLHLNQQIIMLLNNIGVSDDVFLDLMRFQINLLSSMFINESDAKANIKSICPFIHWDSFEKARIQITTERFLRSVMMARYKSSMRDLVEKSKVPIHPDEARVLLGVMDETGILQYGQVFIQISKTLSEDLGEKRIIQRKVVISKNPCLHPGDIRTFDAVDVPQLYHMVDVVVFPKIGPRPHPNELSGSDLDGDKYHCMWHEKLIPTLPNKEPMSYPKDPKKELSHAPGVKDMIDHMCEYIESDTLGQIDNTHLALADQLGLESSECIELAMKHSKAVDAPKTGNWQKIEKEVKELLTRYPDFMMKTDKPSYPSEKVLGKMFRECNKYMSFCESPHGFQAGGEPGDVLFCMEGYKDFEDDAVKNRFDYNAQLMMTMKMYGINTEAEIMSCCINSLDEKLWSEKHDITEVAYKLRRNLVARFRKRFEEDEKLLSIPDERVRHLRKLHKASAWYWASYVDEDCETFLVGNTSQRFLSFPWVVSDYLAEIYMKNKDSTKYTTRNVYISLWESIITMLREGQRPFRHCFGKQGELVSRLQEHLHRESTVVLHGPAATCLLDGTGGSVNVLLVRKWNPMSLMKKPYERERLLGKVADHLRNHSYNCKSPDKERLLVTLRDQTLDQRKAEITADPSVLKNWLILKEYIFKNKWLFPYFRVLMKWTIKIGLVGGRGNFIPDYLVLFLFLNYCMSFCPEAIRVVPNAMSSASTTCNNLINDLVDSKSAVSWAFGRVEEWENLMQYIVDNRPPHDNVYKVFLTFFRPKTNGVHVLDNEIEPALREVFPGEGAIGRLLSDDKKNLLEGEMDRAFHRIALHIDAAALFSNISIERNFFIQARATEGVMGNEENLRVHLRNISGAKVQVFPKSNPRDPGMVVKAFGSGAELYILEKYIKKLNDRFNAEATKNVSVRGADKVEACHSLLMEGSSSSEDRYVALEPYFGKRHYQHSRRYDLYVARYRHTSSRETPGGINSLYNRFQDHFKQQLRSLKRVYSPLYGELKLSIKFGRTYIVSPPQNYVEDVQGLSIQEVLDALERKKMRPTMIDWDSGPMRVAIKRSPQATKGRQEISMSFISYTTHEALKGGIRQWLDVYKFYCIPEEQEEGVKLVFASSMGSNYTAVYDNQLNFRHVENGALSWVISDIKRECPLPAGGHMKEGDELDGSECDIRFMLKTEKEPLEAKDSALVSGLQLETALYKDEDGLVQIKNEEVRQRTDHYKQYTRYVFRRVGESSQPNQPAMNGNAGVESVFMDRISLEAIKFCMYQRQTNSMKYDPPEELWELRVIPPAKALLNPREVDQLLEDVWKLSFDLSSRMKLAKDTGTPQ